MLKERRALFIFGIVIVMILALKNSSYGAISQTT